jgi:tryptophan-rich sensory protein
MSDRTWFVWLAMLALSVVMALIWAYQFYRPHNFMAAAIALSLAALITLPLTILNFSNTFAIGMAFLPYQIWVILASTLSWGYFALNKSN